MGEVLMQPLGYPSGSDDCTATAGQVLEGQTAITRDSGDEPITGTMPNVASSNGIDSAVSVTENDGYTYVRMHPGAHITNASSNYPEVSVRTSDFPSYSTRYNSGVSSVTISAITNDSNGVITATASNGASSTKNADPLRGQGQSVNTVGVDSHGPYAYIPWGFYPSYSGKTGYAYVYMTNDQARTLANGAGVGYNAGYNSGYSAVTSAVKSGSKTVTLTGDNGNLTGSATGISGYRNLSVNNFVIISADFNISGGGGNGSAWADASFGIGVSRSSIKYNASTGALSYSASGNATGRAAVEGGAGCNIGGRITKLVLMVVS